MDDDDAVERWASWWSAARRARRQVDLRRAVAETNARLDGIEARLAKVEERLAAVASAAMDDDAVEAVGVLVVCGA